MGRYQRVVFFYFYIYLMLDVSEHCTVGVGQCKRYNRKIGSHEIREFAGSMVSDGCHTGYFLTTSRFTRDAKLARNKAEEKFIMIELWDIDVICDKVRQGGCAKILLKELDNFSALDTSKSGPVGKKSWAVTPCPADILQSPAIGYGAKERRNAPAICSHSCDIVDLESEGDITLELAEGDKENITKEKENIEDLNDLMTSVSNLRMGGPAVPEQEGQNTSYYTPVKTEHTTSLTSSSPYISVQNYSPLYHYQHSPRQNPTTISDKFRSCSKESEAAPSPSPRTPRCGPPSPTSSSTPVNGPGTAGGNSTFRDSERWKPEEVKELEALVARFTIEGGGKNKRSADSTSISWKDMEKWLRENAASEDRVECALRPSHFDSSKLRCRWK